MRSTTKRMMTRLGNYRKAFAKEFYQISDAPRRGVNAKDRGQIAGMWRATKARYGRKGVKSFLRTYHK